MTAACAQLVAEARTAAGEAVRAPDLAVMAAAMGVTALLPRRPTATAAAEMAATATAQAPTLTVVAAASTTATAAAAAATSTTPGAALHQGPAQLVGAEGLISRVSPRASLETWGVGQETPHHLQQGPSLSWLSSSLPLSQ